MCQLWPYLVQENVTTVTHAPIPTKLDYYNTFYIGLPLKLAQKVKMAQNSAACELISSQQWLTDIYCVCLALFEVSFWEQFKAGVDL